MSLEEELRRLVARDWDQTVDCVAAAVARDRDVPRREGDLASSIRGGGPGRWNGDTYLVEIVQDGTVAPHGAIINNPQPGDIVPRRAKALRFEAGGGTVFASRVRKSTEHRGWWDRVTSRDRLDRWIGGCSGFDRR